MKRVALLPGYAVGQYAKALKDGHFPPCEGVMVTPPAHRGRNIRLGGRCSNIAKLFIGGKSLCIRHAEKEALRILMEEANVQP